jgi:probable addiction module antidote protein
MSPLKTRPFDPANYLDNDEAIAAYMEEAMKTNDPAFIVDALGVCARARGMSEIASSTGLSRENLYRSLSVDGNPEYATVMKVTEALGLRFTVKRVAKKKRAA